MSKDVLEGYRLSPRQKQIWMAQDRLGVRRGLCRAELTGDLDVELLRSAIGAVVERHEILRTRYAQVPGMALPVQVIGKAAWRFTEEAASALDAQSQADFTAAREQAMRQGAVEEGATLDVTLIRLSPGRAVLLAALPGLAADRASLGLLVADIARHYAALAEGREVAGEPMQYADFAEWHQDVLASPPPEAVAYWRAQSGEGAEELRIAAQKPSPEGPFNPRAVEVPLNAQMARRILAAAGEAGVTAQAFLLACWQTLLWRLSGASPFALGLASDMRKYEELADALGPFTLMVPLACTPSPDMPFDALLRDAEKALQETRKAQEYFKLAADGGAGDVDGLPFGFEATSRVEPVEASGVTFTVTAREHAADRRRMWLLAEIGDGVVRAWLEIDENAFDLPAVRRVATQLSTLMADALANPQARLGDLNMVCDEERRRLREEFNDTAFAAPAELCAHQLIEAQAARHPDRTAVAMHGRQLSYGELEGRANQLARALRRRGVGPEVCVGIHLGRSPELVVALLAVWKAGGAYVPLEPSLPLERLQFMVAESEIPLVLTLSADGAAARQLGAPVFCLDEEEAWRDEPASRPAALAVPANLAYVLYTSGSTGRPKGVMVTHAGLVNYLSWAADYYGLAALDEAPLHTPLSFDLTVTSLWVPLAAGRRVELLDETAGVAELAGRLRAAGRRLVKLTPAHVAALNSELGEAGAQGRGGEVWVVGGEALSLGEVAGWVRRGVRVVNEYGPTEAVVGCSVWEVGEAALGGGRVAIGQGVGNARLYVVDEQLREVGVGVAGEIVVGGAGLGRGYVKRGDQTAAAWVPDGLSGAWGGRLYRTGDVGRWNEAGELEYVGRRDGQVKVRGYRVEVGEVEAAVRGVAGVREAVVVAEGEGAGRRLVGYVVLAEGVGVEEVRRAVEGRLPGYMVPGVWVAVDELPVTRHGKVDRGRLPSAAAALAARAGESAAPATPTQQAVAEIWQELLRVGPIGVDANFFDLGGHSLIAMQIIARVKSAFQVDLPLAHLFESPTVAGQASLIDEALRAGATQPAGAEPTIRRRSRSIDQQLDELDSPAQERPSAEEAPQPAGV